MNTQALSVFAVLGLLVTAAFLAAAETSLTFLPKTRALALVQEGRRGAKSLVRLLEHREQFLNPVLLLVLACHLAMATLVGLLAEQWLGPWGALGALGVEVAVIFVLAEAVPKTLAIQRAEQSALLCAPVINAIARFLPLRLLTRGLIVIANLLTPGRQSGEAMTVSEEELLAMTELALEADVIESGERTLIRSVIDFGDTVTREVMVPRPDMVAVAADATVGEALEVVLDHGYSRIPAHDGTIDEVSGLVYAKDLLRATRDARESAPIRPLLRPAHFVPETKRVAELLREMQARSFHMAIVVDEYGGTAGLVTLEDLIEELVGEIVDEFDVEAPLVEALPGGDIRVNARMSLDELNELLNIGLPVGDWDSVGGLVLDLLGHVPHEGEEVEVDGHRLRAEMVKGRRIGRVRVMVARRGQSGAEGADEEAELGADIERGS